MAVVSGTVLDSSGNPASRTVRAYRRDTGVMIGQAISGDGVTAEPGDPSYTSVSLLLAGNGANGGTSFPDTSPTPKTITKYGTAQTSTAQSKFGGSSIYFNGTTDYLTAPHSGDLDLATGDWTIEAWIYISALSGGSMDIVEKDGVAGSSYAQYNLAVTSTGKLAAFLGNGNGVSPTGTSYTGSTTISLNAQHHVALVKTGTLCKGFLDGSEEWSATAATMYDGAKALFIGYQSGQPTTNHFNGYISDIRITKGVARYTTGFTPPTIPSYPYEEGPIIAAGEYSLSFPYAGEVNVVCLDDVSGATENDLILRTTPV